MRTCQNAYHEKTSRLISDLRDLIWQAKRMSFKNLFLRKWFLNANCLALLSISVFCGFTCVSAEIKPDQGSNPKPTHKEIGKASWYGSKFQGKETANGEIFDPKDMTAAHPNLPMGSKAKVTNLENGKEVDVRINDRGPYVEGRAIDLSKAAAKKLDMKESGTNQVKIESPSPHKKSNSNKQK